MLFLSYFKQLLLWLVIFFIIGLILYYLSKYTTESFTNKDSYKSENEYKEQVAKITNLYAGIKEGKRPVTTLLSNLSENDMPEKQRIFVNFNMLACRYPGYIGPMLEGYFDADIGVQAAVNAGCRVFVLDIDYLEDCHTDTIYYPQLVVRDTQNRLRIKPSSNIPLCNTSQFSNIKTVCEKINYYAFSSAAQNNKDPIIIVLYFVRKPPTGGKDSKVVLDYYSEVAKALYPFRDRLLSNETLGGKYYRHQQEDKLLINDIRNYNGKVLIFSNADTSGFTKKRYAQDEDLDFMINLRLYYTMTKVGETANSTGSIYGILQTADDYLYVPKDRESDVAEDTKLRWTVCLSKDPTKQVSKETYNKITNTYGVHSVPVILFDEINKYMFDNTTFKTYSFIPKPVNLRYIKPPVVVPAEPNPSTDARGGELRSPSVN
jgi:hypothetical protein